MNRIDPHATLRTAEAIGARIQANRGTEDEPKWETIEGKAQFTCPSHLYRVHPEDRMTPNKLPPLPELPDVIAEMLKFSSVLAEDEGIAPDVVREWASALQAVSLRQSQSLPAGAVAGLADDADRVEELAERLVRSGPKAAHVSASETHELSDWVRGAAPIIRALQADAREKGEAPDGAWLWCKLMDWQGSPRCSGEAHKLNATQPAQAPENGRGGIVADRLCMWADACEQWDEAVLIPNVCSGDVYDILTEAAGMILSGAVYYRSVNYKDMYEQMAERCTELDTKLAEYEGGNPCCNGSW